MQVDLTATSSTNYIDSEHASKHDISGNTLIVPKYAPFYAKDLVVSVLQENGVTVTLVKDTDYVLAAKWHDIGLINGGVYSAIFITNKTLRGQWFLRYRALGGNATVDVRQFIEFFAIVAGKYDISATQSLVNPTQGFNVSTLRDYVNVQSGYAALPIIAAYFLADQTSSSDSVSSSGQDQLQQLSNLVNQAVAIANNAARVAQTAQADVTGKFVMPIGGIGRELLATDVQTSLAKADTGSGGGASAVTSVNGKLGDVNLTAADISGLGTAATQQVSAFATATQGAKADTAIQSIPKAGTTTSGTVKIGSGIDLSPDSTISVTTSSIGAATAAQGAKADSALQVAPVTSVAGKNGIVQLTTADIGGLGSAASHSTADFASAAQGTKADNAVQIVNGKTGNSIDISAADIGALSQTTADGRYATIAQGVKADSAVQTINGKTGSTVTLTAADIGGLASSATVDTTNAFNITTGVFNKSLFPSLDTTDITGLGTAALQPATAFATAAQGVAADLALAGLEDKQNILLPGSNVSIVNNTISFNSTGQYRPVKQADTAMILDVTPVITSTLILPANNQRVGLLFDNPSNATLYISFGEPVTDTRYSVRINPQDQYETSSFVFTGEIYGKWSEIALEPVIVTELIDSTLAV